MVDRKKELEKNNNYSGWAIGIFLANLATLITILILAINFDFTKDFTSMNIDQWWEKVIFYLSIMLLPSPLLIYSILKFRLGNKENEKLKDLCEVSFADEKESIHFSDRVTNNKKQYQNVIRLNSIVFILYVVIIGLIFILK